MQGNVCVGGKLVSECFYIYAAVIMFNCQTLSCGDGQQDTTYFPYRK